MSSWSRTQNVELTFLTMTSSPYLNRVWEGRLIKITFACSQILAELSLFSCQKKISGSFEFLLSFSRPWWLVKRNMVCQHWKVKRVEDWFLLHYYELQNNSEQTPGKTYTLPQSTMTGRQWRIQKVMSILVFVRIINATEPSSQGTLRQFSW